MLVIRRTQIEKLEEAALRSFEDEMVAHLAEFSPPLFKSVGEEQMRKAICFGIGRAYGYGFVFRGPVRLYLELMLLFGSHFDTDPQYPWAAEILIEHDTDSQMERAERLYQKTMDYLENVAGPDDAFALEALKNIATVARQPMTLPSGNFTPAILQEITKIYPQKAAYVGIQRLEILTREGIKIAKHQDFQTARGAGLIVLLMFMLGCGCVADPIYPWIERTLKDSYITDSDTRANRLERKALTWLEHVLGDSGRTRL